VVRSVQWKWEDHARNNQPIAMKMGEAMDSTIFLWMIHGKYTHDNIRYLWHICGGTVSIGRMGDIFYDLVRI